MKRVRMIAVPALSLSVPLLAAGCGDSGEGDQGRAAPPDTTAAAEPTASTPAAGASPSGDGTRLGGAESGITLSLPSGWKPIDPLKESSAVVRTSFGLGGDTGSLVGKLMEKQVEQGIVFAIDTSVTSGFAPHLQAGCDRGGMTGASLEQLKRKQRALEPGSKITDLTIGGRSGFKATYSSQKRSGPVSGLTVRVPVATDRFCFVDIEAKQGEMPPEVEQIAASFRPI